MSKNGEMEFWRSGMLEYRSGVLEMWYNGV